LILAVAEALGAGRSGPPERSGRWGYSSGCPSPARATPPYRAGNIVKQVHFIGVKSVLVIVLTAAFTGMVLALQGYNTLRRFGRKGFSAP